MHRCFRMGVVLCITLSFTGCDQRTTRAAVPDASAGQTKPKADATHVLKGRIFGTTWQAKIRGESLDEKALTKRIAALLEAVDKGMSTWRKDSELSVFNRAAAGPFEFGAQTAAVIRQSFVVAQMTGGAFDPTVRPLIALWGFGAGARQEPPSAKDLAQARAAVGYTKLRWAQPKQLVKAKPDLSLDLSAIAKGFAVDQVADLLKASGASSGMVEIGGEVVAWGERHQGGAWRLAVDAPIDGASSGQGFAAIVELRDAAMATSGDYRQFRIEKGRRVQHIVDPRTGMPVDHGLASVTVVAPDCMTADAYATALMVLGVEAGLTLVNSHADLEALFLVRQGSQWRQVRSRAMNKHLLLKPD